MKEKAQIIQIFETYASRDRHHIEINEIQLMQTPKLSGQESRRARRRRNRKQ